MSAAFLFALALLLLLGLVLPFDQWPSVLAQPLYVLRGTDQKIKARIVDLSGSDAVWEIGRRVLQPWGTLTLIQLHTDDDLPKSGNAPVTSAPAQKTDPHNR